MHCQQGGEVWACFGLLNAFRRFSGSFEPFLGSVCHRSDWSWSLFCPVRVLVLCTCWAPVVATGLTGQSWADAATLLSSSGLHTFIQGELHWFRGSLHVCRWPSLWFSSFGLVVCALCLSMILSQMCRAVALAYGVRDLSSSSNLALFLSLVFDHLLKFLFIRFFSFSFLSGYYMCVLSMHSSRGRLRTMCGSRTGGWSLLGVMSDWQRCVDWFLANYCRYRFRLDWCWCRWRTSVKGRWRWGLQVWRRQVGFVRGTRWPAESSAGRMVARTARWSHGQFHGWATKPRSSRDYVGAKSWMEIGGGYTEFVGFPVVHQKTTGFLGCSTKPRPENRRRRCSSTRPVWLVGLTSLTGGCRSDRFATT
jgi:hypothetical protein